MKKLFKILLILLVIVKLSLYIVSNRDFFVRVFDPVYISDLYSKSQYVIGERSKGGIGDDGLYAFAGYYYFFQHGDVSKVNFEHPPLGKYLIGLSIFLFRNENIINIIYFILLLLITYKIGQLIFDDNIYSILSCVILSFEPLFLDHLLRSLLDLPFTLFFTAGVYFFLKGLKNGKYYFLSMLFWGAAFSTRFFPAFLIVYIYMMLVIMLLHIKSLKLFFVSSFLVPLVYLICHISFFIYNPSIILFLRHKKWMLSWFTGTPVIFGNIWQNIFTGTYIDSTGKLAHNNQWSIIQPFIVLLSIFSIRKSDLKKKNKDILIIYGLIIIYFIYLTFLTGGLEKFLMPIYPLLIILAIRNTELIYSIIKTWFPKRLILSKVK